MFTQENLSNQDTYVLTPEKERELKKIAREDYYLRQLSIIDNFRNTAMEATKLAAQLEHANPELAEKAKENAKKANYDANMIEWVLKKDKTLDEKEDIIAEQAISLSGKETIIKEKSCIIEALKSQLNAYGIPYNDTIYPISQELKLPT